MGGTVKILRFRRAVRNVRRAVGCKSGRRFHDRRGASTGARTGRGGVVDQVGSRRVAGCNTDASSVVARAFTNDIRFHRNGTSRTMELIAKGKKKKKNTDSLYGK
jgi:hypothetical protein